ncbi:MAG: TonB-dependent receptor, partial [Bacteroidia bacterium]
RLVKQAVFANATIGVKEMVFLDISARNDWASSLALTGNQSYFYPAVGLTGLISNMVNLPDVISSAKVRASYTYVGNEVPFNVVNPQHTINAGGGINRNTQTPFTDLKPELITSMEVGADVRFFTGRLGLDFTYYNITSNDQFLSLPAPSGSGYTTYFVNAGEINNKGVEITLNAIPMSSSVLQWNTSFNFATNTNTVVEIHPDIGTISMGTSESVAIRFEAGGSMGDLWASAFVRDAQNRIVVSDEGMPRKQTDFAYMGNVEPDWTLGWNNNLSYGKFGLSALFTGKFGGVVISQAEAMLDGYGVSKRTGDARDAGSLAVDAALEDGSPVSSVDPKTWFLATGDRNGIMEYYVYDRTNIRLSQLSLSYTLSLRQDSSPVNMTFSLYGRNLFFITKKAPFDPDLVMSTDRNNQGLDNFNLPTTRTIGFNLNINF